MISFLQLVNLKKNKYINNHSEKVFNYTNRRQDYILLNNGELELEFFSKKLDLNYKLLINNNSLSCNNKLVINEPVLINIYSSVYYNIKALKNSNFLFYCSDYNNVGVDVKFDYYKLDNLSNNYNKYIKEEYPYFDFKYNELIV
tara:strand:+ start:2470 stop:2901 length:432 start_codon:yes stop_codon:yes gene_type:complete